MGPQLGALRRDPHVIIATPGRLIDHLEQKHLSLKGVSIMVLDEADRMLDMGFWPQVKRLSPRHRPNARRCFFRDTFPRDHGSRAEAYENTDAH